MSFYELINSPLIIVFLKEWNGVSEIIILIPSAILVFCEEEQGKRAFLNDARFKACFGLLQKNIFWCKIKSMNLLYNEYNVR